ncbi:chitin-binding type-2 domain-containing protein [Nephila pilipes]|uniref:Chitin-binding type-2 domain-containing protein n=1 Tax=Nephila pilipes TaxID=299642 RepID=A0A8X6UHI0_NEPPI|nr:chitin-binding type-2 domain-containing protein [Nephila pilipes]
MISPRIIFLLIVACTFHLHNVCRAKQIRGIPEVDYPTYYVIPKTSFLCSDQLYNPGFYADIETRCQVFHYCYEHRKESFLCPLGTIFNQPILSCDYWYSSNCTTAPAYYYVNVKENPSKTTNLFGDQSDIVLDKVIHLHDGDTKSTEISVKINADSNYFQKIPLNDLGDENKEPFDEPHIQNKRPNEDDLDITPETLFETVDETRPEFVRYKIKNSNELNVHEGSENEDNDDDAGDELLLGTDGMVHLSDVNVDQIHSNDAYLVPSGSDELEHMPSSDFEANADIKVKSFDSLESKIQEPTVSELHRRLSSIEHIDKLPIKRPRRRKPIIINREPEVKLVALPVEIVKSQSIGMDSVVQPSESTFVSASSSDIHSEETSIDIKDVELNTAFNDISKYDFNLDSKENVALLSKLNRNSTESKSKVHVLDETLTLAFNANDSIKEYKNGNATTGNEYHKDLSDENAEIAHISSDSEEIPSRLLEFGDEFYTESTSNFKTYNPVFEHFDSLTNSRREFKVFEGTRPEKLAINYLLEHAELTNGNEYENARHIDMITNTERMEDEPDFQRECREQDYSYFPPDASQEFQRNYFGDIYPVPSQIPEIDEKDQATYYLLPDSEYEYQFDHSHETDPEDVNYSTNANLEVNGNDAVKMESVKTQNSNYMVTDVRTNEKQYDKIIEAPEELTGNDLTSQIEIVKSKVKINSKCKESQSLCLQNSKDTPENLSDGFPELNVVQIIPTKKPRGKYKLVYKEDKYEDLTSEDIKLLESEAPSEVLEMPAEAFHDDENTNSAASEESEILDTETPFKYRNMDEEYQKPILSNEIDSIALDKLFEEGEHKINGVFKLDSKFPKTDRNVKKEKPPKIGDSDQFVSSHHETLTSSDLIKSPLAKDIGSFILTDSKSNTPKIAFENISYKKNLPIGAIEVVRKIPTIVPVSKQNIQKVTDKKYRKPRAFDAPIPINLNPLSALDMGEKQSYFPITKHSILKPYDSGSYDRDFESSMFFSRTGHAYESSKLSKLKAFGKKLLRAKRAKLNILIKFME